MPDNETIEQEEIQGCPRCVDHKGLAIAGLVLGMIFGGFIALTVMRVIHSYRPEKHTGPIQVAAVDMQGHYQFVRPNGETFVSNYELPDHTRLTLCVGAKFKDITYRDGKYSFDPPEFIKAAQ